jgi:aminopeptidase
MSSVSEAEFAPLAQVGVRVGVNLQPGQRLIVQAPVGQVEAARAVARAAYAAGARSVEVVFTDERISRDHMELASDEGLADFPQWLADGLLSEAEAGSAFLAIAGGDPAAFEGLAPERVATAMGAQQTALLPLMRRMMGHSTVWSAIAAPSPAWAARVFPDLDAEPALRSLWQAILRASRADGPDPVGAWREHIANLQARRAWLDALQIESLHYRAPGTDLAVPLPDGHLWVASGQERPVGYATSPNIPSEEVFTLPLRDGVEGTVQGTRPLSYQGQVIDGIALTLRAGRIVDARASRGEAALQAVIDTDEGSHHLGEVALVPVDSPIYRSGLLFYNTLFDENAACHLAIGAAYPTCLADSESIQGEADLLARGGNASLVHVDFMVGSQALDIDARTRDGRTVPIFRAGHWAAAVG